MKHNQDLPLTIGSPWIHIYHDNLRAQARVTIAWLDALINELAAKWPGDEQMTLMAKLVKLGGT